MHRRRYALVKVTDTFCTIVCIDTGENKRVSFDNIQDYPIVNIDVTDYKQFDAYRNVTTKLVIVAYTEVNCEKYIYVVGCESLYGKWQTLPQAYKSVRKHKQHFINAKIIKKDNWEYELAENPDFPIPFTSPLAKLIKSNHYPYTYIIDVTYCINDYHLKISNKFQPGINNVIILGLIKGKSDTVLKTMLLLKLKATMNACRFLLGCSSVMLSLPAQ